MNFRAMTLLALLAASTASAASVRAPNLSALLDREPLCYDAVVTIDKTVQPALEKRAEERIAQLLSGVGLSAEEFDQAEDCSRVLSFTFDADNNGAPGIYNGGLSVETLLAFDNETDVNIATIWDSTFWGGARTTYSQTELRDRMDRVLNDAISAFKTDFAAAKAK